MVVHQDRELLYVVDRAHNDVFVYDTNTFLMYEHWNLPSNGLAWGIDILDDTLFVTEQNSLLGPTQRVRWYDIDTHQQLGSYQFPNNAIGLVVTEDLHNPADGPLIYATEFNGACLFQPCDKLSRYKVGTGQLDTWTPGKDGKGLSANVPLGLIYEAQGSPSLFGGPPPRLMVMDAGTGALLNEYPLAKDWKPTDVVASTIPFGGSVSKKLVSHPSERIVAGQTARFEIEITNKSDNDLVFIPLQDEYETNHLAFQSANHAPIDPTDDGELNWANLAIAHGGPLPPGQKIVVEIEFIAKECTEQMEGSNLGKVDGALDSNGNEFYAAGVADYLILCQCEIDFDCDNGIFCDGKEICDEKGECGPGTIPCQDDGEFCNGEESCDENEDECVSSGDPCEADEECNESTDSCDAVDSSDDDSPEPEGDDDELWPEGKVTGGCCGC